ncbi:hypothetical protein [Streptomyces sp. FIT100]|uniref:hypothetical protein n=1 Tax=Streptomyces sp. FIT100 TaxID=2837956 RepID=UPI0021C9A7F5|nr:hypothetical protein [Streptomyces sp. FIT100]UUN25491.1 hypothetical protein KK483_02935 [Streptomyces sp. FIT100]
MKVIRRLALYVALPLTVAAVAGHGWYQFSDTGKRWRYEDRLATYCQGLIPPEESAVITGYDTVEGLPNDVHHGGSDGYELCWVGRRNALTIARIPASARDDDGRRGVFDLLRPSASKTPPLPLGGGWQGYTNLKSAAVVLECTNQDASVVVSSASAGGGAADGATTELVAATAVRAADRWGCAADPGGPLPKLPDPPAEKSPLDAEGTCAGIPMRGMDMIHWIRETTSSAGTAPLESCVLGETKARAEELFVLSARFGPLAQARASDTDPDGDAGHVGVSFWATAKCPGADARALFTISTTAYVHENADAFARSALSAFAERASAQRGCTDLRLPG